jgi:hypothetical protein
VALGGTNRTPPSAYAFRRQRGAGAPPTASLQRAPSLGPLSLLAAFDSIPTATFDLGLKGWAATISLSVQVLGLPVPGPLRLRGRVHETAVDLVTLTCDIWDADSSLRATGVQLCGLRGELVCGACVGQLVDRYRTWVPFLPAGAGRGWRPLRPSC